MRPGALLYQQTGGREETSTDHLDAAARGKHVESNENRSNNTNLFTFVYQAIYVNRIICCL